MITTITHAEPSNVEALANLAEEMDRFYGATEIDPLERRIRQIYEALFHDPPSAYALLAWGDGELVGFAAYSFLWPAIGLTRSLYLKELYIAKNVRRKGVGKVLMQHLHALAVERDCSRVEWQTDLENLDAQRFYADLGVPVDESKLFYRIQGDDLKRKAKP
jgi:GNAT superfamily N-acetyltransferase